MKKKSSQKLDFFNSFESLTQLSQDSKWRAKRKIKHLLSSKPYLVDIIGKLPQTQAPDKNVLIQKYVHEGLSLAQIAEQVVSSKEAVRSGLKSAGARLRCRGQHHGRPAQPRYGKRVVAGKQVDHLGKQRVIRAIGEMREQQGLSYRQIGRILDYLKVPTKCRGRGWHPEMVRRIAAGRTIANMNDNTMLPASDLLKT